MTWYTPGPWECDGPNVNGSGGTICTVSWLPNARLIAAVPEMHETLEALADEALWNNCAGTYCGGYKTEHEIEVFRHGMRTVCNVVAAAARAAIAKAEGSAE